MGHGSFVSTWDWKEANRPDLPYAPYFHNAFPFAAISPSQLPLSPALLQIRRSLITTSGNSYCCDSVFSVCQYTHDVDKHWSPLILIALHAQHIRPETAATRSQA